MRVLLTGGAGYIGSHIAVVLLEEGHDVIVIDDFSNSHPEAVRRVEELSGRPVIRIDCDLADLDASSRALADVEFDSVIHLAGLKSIGESVSRPSSYYRTNIVATLNILDIMAIKDVRRFVFSSSATVYGTPDSPVIDESHPVGRGLTNPYGWSKWMNEQIIRDVQHARPELEVSLLRYFNPVGAHPSGQIGESPSGTPNNLMPYVAQVAAGTRDRVSVFGDSYATPDGTGVRDYIHIMDLAEGHLAALAHLSPGVTVYNLGTGVGHSVLELIREFSAQSGREIPYRVTAPRTGDVSSAIADPAKANSELGWRATRSLADSCRDSWLWQSQNPQGLTGQG
ncbi:UDP-glucose 4-epimerase GalE [Microbacterium sp. 3J1]|uniref:UDP-glucose 4-epimerase GalE n=1 Tax=Microbacterium sp. 3J1 TaxID=861269 RepID=UPI000A7ECC4F|nr:UDP-glucose 4-epimerase GalE [Microbacterium sp. 3J1]